MTERLCSGCGKGFPATTEFFSPDKRNKRVGLHRYCKACRARQHRETTRLAAQQRAAQHYRRHPEELALARAGHFFAPYAHRRWDDYTRELPPTRRPRHPDNKATAHRRTKSRALVVAYKREHPCSRCGETDPACLQFHHRDPASKSFEIGKALGAGMPIRKVVQEMEKCDLLCANCHLKLHASEYALS